MAYKRVYSPEGEIFEVPEERANRLILNSGWTQNPVKRTKKETKKPFSDLVFVSKKD